MKALLESGSFTSNPERQLRGVPRGVNREGSQPGCRVSEVMEVRVGWRLWTEVGPASLEDGGAYGVPTLPPTHPTSSLELLGPLQGAKRTLFPRKKVAGQPSPARGSVASGLGFPPLTGGSQGRGHPLIKALSGMT